jgi:hypothetical protein
VIHSFLTFFHFCYFSSSHDWLREYLSWAGSCLGEVGIYIRYLIFHSKKIIESICVCSTSLAFWRRTTKASERLAEDESDYGASGSSTASLYGGFEAAA